jgi:hypothetical protein
MTEPFKPRPNDHLVEPMYTALGEEVDDGLPSSSVTGRRNRLPRWVLLVTLFLGAAIAWYWAG